MISPRPEAIARFTPPKGRVASQAGFNKIYVNKALNRKLVDASGYFFHEFEG